MSNNKIIVIAVSTGGPQALKAVIPNLPKELDTPVVILQHMYVGFTKSLANRLNSLSELTTVEITDGELIEKGKVYIAPSGFQTFYSNQNNGSFRVVSMVHPSTLAPCADLFYESLIESDYDEIVCCVMTGMGRDATEGILKLKKHKKVHVLTQSGETCIVNGMPNAARKAGCSDEEVALCDIAKKLTEYVEVQ